MVATDASGLGHGMELVLLPKRDRAEVSNVVVDGADRPSDCDALKRDGHHPTVLGVQIAFIDKLAIAGQERVFLVPELSVCLSQDENRILGISGGRMKEVGATRVLRRVERLGRVANRSEGKRIPEPPGLVGEPATEGPRLVPCVITVEAIE